MNYFDIAPHVYEGWSEKSALNNIRNAIRVKSSDNRKLSNFSNYTHKFNRHVAGNRSEDLQVDYIGLLSVALRRQWRHQRHSGHGTIDNGMIDFLMEGRIRPGVSGGKGFSFHGTTDVFDEILAMHDHIHWDFVQIQLNYADWRHASGNNVNAEYLYGELVKRDIPAIIMEPMLGGRLSRLNDHLVARLKQHRPQEM